MFGSVAAILDLQSATTGLKDTSKVSGISGTSYLAQIRFSNF